MEEGKEIKDQAWVYGFYPDSFGKLCVYVCACVCACVSVDVCVWVGGRVWRFVRSFPCRWVAWYKLVWKTWKSPTIHIYFFFCFLSELLLQAFFLGKKIKIHKRLRRTRFKLDGTKQLINFRNRSLQQGNERTLKGKQTNKKTQNLVCSICPL